MYSDDGQQWFDAASPGADLEWVEHTGGRFVAAGEGGACTTSTDGEFWSPCDLTTDTIWNLVGLEGSFWALTPQGSFVSTDGLTWTSDDFWPPAAVAPALGGFVMVDDGRRGFASSLAEPFTIVEVEGGLRDVVGGRVLYAP